MALKDTWKDLQDAVAGVEGSGSDISVEPINKIAQAVIDLEQKEVEINVDNEMSDTSENPVQNRVIKSYVDDSIGNVEEALNVIIDEQNAIIEMQNSLIGGEGV